MWCSSCEKKRQLLIAKARQRIIDDNNNPKTHKISRKWTEDKNEKISRWPWDVCPGCANYRFYCTCWTSKRINETRTSADNLFESKKV